MARWWNIRCLRAHIQQFQLLEYQSDFWPGQDLHDMTLLQSWHATHLAALRCELYLLEQQQ